MWKKLTSIGAHMKPRKSNTCRSTMLSCEWRTKRNVVVVNNGTQKLGPRKYAMRTIVRLISLSECEAQQTQNSKAHKSNRSTNAIIFGYGRGTNRNVYNETMNLPTEKYIWSARNAVSYSSSPLLRFVVVDALRCPFFVRPAATLIRRWWWSRCWQCYSCCYCCSRFVPDDVDDDNRGRCRRPFVRRAAEDVETWSRSHAFYSDMRTCETRSNTRFGFRVFERRGPTSRTFVHVCGNCLHRKEIWHK